MKHEDIYIGKLKSIRPILEKWLFAQKKYISKEDDYPWWYNERASISFLAASAWKTNNIALEEYCTRKGIHKNKMKNGRCDIYFTCGDECFAGEAKQAWIYSGTRSRISLKEKLNNGLKEAKRCTRKLHKHEGRRLAICFAIPYVPKEDKNNIKKLIKNFIEALKQLKQFDATSYAYYFLTKNFDDCKGEDGYFFPGNAILIREIKRGS